MESTVVDQIKQSFENHKNINIPMENLATKSYKSHYADFDWDVQG